MADAPSKPNVWWDSGGFLRVKWTFDAAWAVFDGDYRVEWQVDNSSAWSVRATIPAGAHVSGGADWEDHLEYGVTANRRYRFRVTYLGGEGNSDPSTPSDWLATTPAAPTSLIPTRDGTDVTFHWGLTSAFHSGIDLQWRFNGGSWSSTVNPASNATSYTRAASETYLNWQSRVRTKSVVKINEGGTTGTLYSDWTESPVLYVTPAAVDGMTAGVSLLASPYGETRVEKITVAWTNHNSVAGPYTALYVDRQVDESTAWTQIATLTGAPNQYVDFAVHGNLPPANHRYRYRVRVSNTAGIATAATPTAWVYTQPAVPASVTATMTDVGAIAVGWTNTAPYRTGTDIDHSTDGGGASGTYADETVASAASSGYSDTGLNTSLPHAYRLRHQIASVPLAAGGTTTLYSAWAYTSNVIASAPPAAPLVSVSPEVADIADGPITVSVIHQPVDFSAQTAANVRYRLTVASGGSGTWTTVAIGTATGLTIPAGTLTAGDWEVQAQTKGVNASYGPWSESVVWKMSTKPQVTITDFTIEADRMTVSWDYYDAETTPQSSFRVQVTDDIGAALVDAMLASADQTYSPLLIPVDGETYTVHVWIWDGDGLMSDEATDTATATFTAPPAPLLSATWHEDTGSVVLLVTNPEPAEGEAEAVAQSVQRWTDGAWVTIGDGLPLSAVDLDGNPSPVALTDPIPPCGIGVVVAYRAVAITEAGAVTTGSVDVATTSRAIRINGGPGWDTRCVLVGDPQVEDGDDATKTLHQWVGADMAVEFASPYRSRSWRISGTIARDADGLAEPELGSRDPWVTIRQLPAPLCLRLPDGTRAFISISAVPVSYGTSPLASVSAVVSEVGDSETAELVAV